MAIRLASAIGQQREPISILGGVDEAINKTGDAIQADLDRKAEAAAKKKDQEQKYKDIVSSNLQTRSLTDVNTKDWEEDQNYQKEGIARVLAVSADPNATKSQLDKELRDFDEGLKKREFLYKRDFKAIGSVAKKQKTHNTALFDNFLIGKTDPTQVSDMPKDDFFGASEMNRAGTMPSENLPSGQGALQNLPNDPNVQGELILLPNDPNFQGKLEELSKNPNLRGIQQSDGSVRVINKGGQNVSAGNKMNEMKRTETTTSFQGVPYFNKSIDERLKTDIDAKADELTTLKSPNIVKAAQGYLGGDFKFGSFTKATTKRTPTTGEIIYEFDEKTADDTARRFASSMVGDGNFGDMNHEQYQRALEYEALRAGNKAGYSGDNLAEFVQETVQKMAYDDFMQNARAAEAERSKNQMDVTKAPSKGMNITVIGNGKYQTETGFYQVDKGKIDTETREQQFRNFKERNLPTILKKTEEQYKAQGKKKAKTAAEDYWNSQKGNEELKSRFDQSYPDTNKKVTRVYPALTPKQDGSNPEVNVVDSRGRTIAFTPSFYNIDEETNKVISVYGVEVVREKGADGTMKTVQKPTTVPYNTKNKVINNVAPELAEVYKIETGKDIDLEVDESTPSKGAAPKAAAKKVEAKFATKNKENLDKAAELINKYRK
jgi:hypothetical protein